jgi:transcription initiation factor TFIID subunit 5
VSSWLAKRGYNKTNELLRKESNLSLDEYTDARLNDTDIAGMVLFHENVANVGARYTESFSALREWVDKSLDRYKVELMGVLYPVFVHCVVDLLSRGLPEDAAAFLKKFGPGYASDHIETVNKLKALVALGASGESALQKLSENADFTTLRKDKMPVALSVYSFRLLFMWLLDGKYMLLLGIFNAHVDVRIMSATPDADGEDFRFFEASANTQELQYKRVKGEDGSVLTNIPLPPKLPVSVLDDMEDDARIAAVRSGKSLPSIAMLTFYHTQGDLNSVSLSDDASLCAAGLGDSSLRLWDLSDDHTWKKKQPGAAVAKMDGSVNGKQYWSLVGHSGPVYGTSFSPCSRFLLSASEDSTVRLWGLDTAHKRSLVVYRGHSFPVWDVAFSPLGYYFATASHDHTARVFGTDRVFPLRILAGHLGDVDCVAWHPNCNYIATGSADNTIRLWEVNTGECVRIFTGHQGAVYSLAFSPDGSMLASGGDDGLVGVWDIGTSKNVAALRGHGKTVWSVSYSTNGNVLASGGGDEKVILWDMQQALAKSASGAAVRPATSEQVTAGIFPTKKTPVSLVKFSRRNLLFCAGASLQQV